MRASLRLAAYLVGLCLAGLCLVGLCLACGDNGNGDGLEDGGLPDSAAPQDDATTPQVDVATTDATPAVDVAFADAAAPIPACSSSISALLTDTLANAPAQSSDAYQQLTTQAATDLRAALTALWADDLESAAASAVAASYTLCREGDVTLWRSTAGAGHATLASRTGGSPRPVVVGVPHPLFESSTPQEGLDAFTALTARALVVASAHRCASSTPSSCSGTTGVCGTAGAPYPVSDMAHDVDSAFHLFHEELLANEPALVVLSLHGMTADGISISDGTTSTAASGSLVATLAPLLAQAFPDDTITSCNPGAGVPHQIRMCGTTNVQGRLVNGSGAPCTNAASSASGRFLHLEQSLAVRTRLDLVVDALDQAL